MSKSGTLAKNTTFLTIAFTIQKILSFFYFAFIARSIGDANLGKYTFALAFSSIFVIFMDFGLGPILTREGAKDDTTIARNLKAMVGAKIGLVALTLIAYVASLSVYDALKPVPHDTLQLTYLAILIIILDTFTFTFYSVFRSKQKLIYEAIGIIIYQFVIVTAGILVIHSHRSIHFVIGAIIAGSVFHFTYSFLLVKLKAKLSLAPTFEWRYIWFLLKISAPFALAGIFFKLSGTVDTLMLHFFAEERHVGWYNVAFKLATALTVLPGAFATGYFPAISHNLKHDPDKVAPVFEQSMFYMMLISLPITAGVMVLANTIIISTYTEAFEASIAALQIFIVSLLFVFTNYPVGNFLNAANKQTRNTVNMGIALLVNIVINFILIPKYTFIGASIAALVSNVLLVLLGLPLVYKIKQFRVWYLLNKLLRVSIAAAAMGIALYAIESFSDSGLYVLILIPLSAVFYFLALLAVKAITKEEMRAFFAVFLRKKIS